MSSNWNGSLTWIRRLGIKFGVPALSWGLLPVSGKTTSLPNWVVMRPPSGGPANAIATWDWAACLPITGKATPDATWASPPCNGPRSSNLPAWSLSPRDCTSPIGPVTTSPARPSAMESLLASAQLPDRPKHLGRCRSAAPPPPLLEDDPNGRPLQGKGGASPRLPNVRDNGPNRGHPQV